MKCLGSLSPEPAGQRPKSIFEWYRVAAAIFDALIALVALSHFAFRVNAVLAFWIAYILTRPFGASIGDYLSQARTDGGLGLGTVVTSALFLVTILALVIYLAVTRRDETRPAAVERG